VQTLHLGQHARAVVPPTLLDEATEPRAHLLQHALGQRERGPPPLLESDERPPAGPAGLAAVSAECRRVRAASSRAAATSRSVCFTSASSSSMLSPLRSSRTLRVRAAVSRASCTSACTLRPASTIAGPPASSSGPSRAAAVSTAARRWSRSSGSRAGEGGAGANSRSAPTRPAYASPVSVTIPMAGSTLPTAPAAANAPMPTAPPTPSTPRFSGRSRSAPIAGLDSGEGFAMARLRR
jgi:hypothetical protein